MIYKADRLVRDVRRCMDENTRDTSLTGIGDTDTLMLDDIIRSKLVEAVRAVAMAAPAQLLEDGHHFGETVHWEEQESGYVMLPDDFMRLVVFEMSDWARPVYRLTLPSDPAYAKCRSRFKSVRGTAERPVCVLGRRPEGRVLEFYSCATTDASVTRGVYVPVPRIDRDGGIDLPERLKTAATYRAGALTLVTVGDTDRAKALMELATAEIT